MMVGILSGLGGQSERVIMGAWDVGVGEEAFSSAKHSVLIEARYSYNSTSVKERNRGMGRRLHCRTFLGRKPGLGYELRALRAPEMQ